LELRDQDELLRQVRGHLQSLRGAGVEWLSAGPAVALALSSSTAEPEESPIASQLVHTPAASATGAGPALDLEPRRQALTVLAAEVKGCTRCPELASTRTQTVFGAGQAGVELCFIGEAPGADEDAQGLPFVGAAGQLLNRIIAGSGFKREEVYICNILKCRPPGNRTPLPNEAANCRGFLERQLELVKPKYIVALGGCAATNLLQSTLSLGMLRGRFHEWKGIPVLVTYHPAYLLPHRAPAKKKDVWEDMKMLLKAMGRPIPQRAQG